MSSTLRNSLIALVLAAPASAQDDGAWSRVTPGEVPPVLEVREAGGRTRLVASEDRLERYRDGDLVAELECTDPDGLGTVRSLAFDSAGLTWVAAEHGLFLVGTDVDVVDRVELEYGAPPGAPTSVWVDPARRVWIATDTSFGVIEPSFFWGRTLTAEDGLPGAGPYRILRARPGTIVLECSEGAFRFDLGRPAAPVVDGIAVDGMAAERGGTVHFGYGADPPLSGTGTGAGGVDLRFRVDDHHVWLPVDEVARIEDLNPGKFRLQVIAIDRELRRSEPFEVRLEVAYPFYFQKTFMLGTAAAAGALIVCAFLVRALRRGGGAWHLTTGALSAVLALVVALQLFAGVVPHARGWPFIGFAMYTHKFAKNDIIYEAGMLGIRDDGTRFPVFEWDLGVLTDGRWQVLRPLIDGGAVAGADAVAKLDERFGGGMAGIQVRSRRIRLTPDGPVEIAPIVLSHYQEQPGG